MRHIVNLLGGVGQARFQALENELAADMNGVKKTERRFSSGNYH